MELLRAAILVASVTAVALARDAEVYRMCVVERSGSDIKAKKYCQLLEDGQSKAKCVIGSSRMDCLRLLTEEKADFAIFEAEIIQAAVNSNSRNLAITHELRYFHKQDYEFEVAVVVRNSAGITNFSQIRGARFCHPGYGYETDWNDIISRFFETRVVEQSCDSNLTLNENYIKSSSQFFGSACKAGPWAPDFRLDSELKSKYPNLCLLCDNPKACSATDKYWGRLGPLFCLTDGGGDIALARLDDIRSHFGLVPGSETSIPPDGYSLLCIDESLVPVTKPQLCPWVAKPWPAIVARSQVAASVQRMVTEVAQEDPDVHWVWAMHHLLNSVQQTPVASKTMMTPEDYLRQAPGFESANSMTHCDPIRVIRICTTSDKESSKCVWLKQAASAFGIEPEIDCIEKSSTEDCMKAIQDKTAEVVIIGPDLLATGSRKYGLKPLLFEYTDNLMDMYRTAAVVRKDSKVKTLKDLKGKKACFTKYDGVGWNTVLMSLMKAGELPSVCPFSKAVGNFFSEICVSGVNSSEAHFKSLCPTDNEKKMYYGDTGTFRCLASGKGDVAFIKPETVSKNTDGANLEPWAKDLKSRDFEFLCNENSTEMCYLSWSARGQLMIDSSITEMRLIEIYTAFLKMSNIFGKHYRAPISAFQLFGKFDGQPDLLFHDSTDRFEDYDTLQEQSNFKNNYEKLFSEIPECKSSATWTEAKMYIVFTLLFTIFLH